MQHEKYLMEEHEPTALHRERLTGYSLQSFENNLKEQASLLSLFAWFRQ
jgi:hypothetical protein